MEQENTMQTSNNAYPSFHFEIDENRIGIVRFDVPDTAYNILNSQFIENLHILLETLSLQNDIQALIFTSNKPNDFIKGFDFLSLENKTEEALKAFTQSAQSVLDKISMLPIPTIAAIQGSCFGIGFELAIACKFRLAADDFDTQFSMPQIRSGLVPFAGGITRLGEIISLRQSLAILLSGKKISAKQALKIGLVDELVPPKILFKIAYQYAKQGDFSKNKLNTFSEKLFSQKERILEKYQFTRNLILEKSLEKNWQAALTNVPVVKKNKTNS